MMKLSFFLIGIILFSGCINIYNSMDLTFNVVNNSVSNNSVLIMENETLVQHTYNYSSDLFDDFYGFDITRNITKEEDELEFLEASCRWNEYSNGSRTLVSGDKKYCDGVAAYLATTEPIAEEKMDVTIV